MRSSKTHLFLYAAILVTSCEQEPAPTDLDTPRLYQMPPLKMEDGEPPWGGGAGEDPNEGSEVRDTAEDYESDWNIETLTWLSLFGNDTPMVTPDVPSLSLFRVRHCSDPDNRYECTSDARSALSHSMFEPWETNNVSRDKQNDTYIAIGGQQNPNKVKHIVFMAAGQQAGSGDNAQTQCGLTGQDTSYKDSFRDDHSLASEEFPLAQDSLVFQILNTDDPDTNAPIRNETDTFVGLALDHRLNYNLANANERVVDAYFEWLNDRFVEGQLESIIFAGHSRGGNLVTKLAQRFAHEGAPDVKIVVQLYEAVSEWHELLPDPVTNLHPGRHRSRIYNPIQPWDPLEFFFDPELWHDTAWQGRWVAWQHAFNRAGSDVPSNVRVLNLTGGRCTLDQPLCVRPVSGMPDVASKDSVSWNMTKKGSRFYEQLWVTTDHGETDDVFVGDDPDAGTDGSRGFRHILASCREMGCL